ncbi:aspartate aminotransferase family protein [Bacteriovorax sp. DB6_IX]|uniref:class-III pyridoxal-phosphate-dependent aminotransferase n=1 Tax=Bacteriovorax sp. DB6_IX TaxID=1353530 RepID=UPI000389E7E3|nr:aspartate aminotransferase family protein [Bacteriovorax sp. DB6_IX]EQC51210.1 aminotransferase, class III [Bacteriovorax sp. DB6_IX]
MNEAYYYSWTKQNSASKLEIKETTVDSYLTHDNREIYDLSSCSYHLSFGLRNERLTNAISDQYKVLPAAGPKLVYNLKQETSQKLLKALGQNEGKIFYTVSGAEAVENALKMARKVSGKEHILSREKSYHGASVGALSITGDWRREGSPLLDHLTHFIPEPFENDALAKTEEIIKKVGPQKIAAICLETITGGNGVYIPDPNWYEGIQNLCRKYKIFLILDEIVCGFARTGKNFAFQHYNLAPDFICMAKNISGGFFPFGAVYTSKEVSDYYENEVLSCGLTNYAHPIGLRVCSEILDLIEEREFVDNIKNLEQTLKDSHQEFNQLSCVKECRQIGNLMAVELDYKDSLSWNDFIKENLYINVSNNILIITPIMMTTPQRLKQALKKLKGVLEKLCEKIG